MKLGPVHGASLHIAHAFRDKSRARIIHHASSIIGITPTIRVLFSIIRSRVKTHVYTPGVLRRLKRCGSLYMTCGINDVTTPRERPPVSYRRALDKPAIGD